jgi:uncharacterized protein (DUF1800 family)
MKISRRDFIKTSSLFTAWVALAACTPIKQSGASVKGTDITPTQNPVLDDGGLIFHTLGRLTFGPTPDMLEKAKQMGLMAFIEEQLSPESIPDTETDTLLGRFATLKMTPGQRFQLDQKMLPVQELIAATVLRQWRSQRQVYEMMVDFWSNHFNIYIGKSLCRVLKTDDDLKAIRPNALGKFNDLLHASAHSPAMLIFLDQAESQKAAPNENYARELMELHTVGVNGGYSQDDVTQVARILTGWTITGPNSLLYEPGQFIFRPNLHDNIQKVVMGKAIAPGGENEGNSLLEMLAQKPNTAQFISQKLARRFITDNPDPAVINTLAQVFTKSDGDTREMIRAVINSDTFKNSAGQKFKRPLEFFLSALRLSGANIVKRSQKLQDYLRSLGQIPFTWQQPNGFPDVAGFWSTTSGLLERWNFGMQLAAGQIDGAELDMKALTKEASTAQDIVDVLSIRFLGARLPDNARSILVDFASSGDLGGNIASVTGLILGSPHFQVR